MKRRLLIILPLLVLFAVGLGLLAKSWLINSDTGTRWMVSRAASSLDGNLSIGKMTGNLNNGLVMSNIQVELEGLEIEILQLKAIGEFSFIPLQLNIKTLQVKDLQIRQTDRVRQTENSTTSMADILGSLSVPIAVNLENGLFTGLQVLDAQQNSWLKLDSVSFSGRWKDRIELRQAEIKSALIEANLSGHIALNPPIDHLLTVSAKLAGDSLMQNPFAASGADPVNFELTVEGNSDQTRIHGSSPATEFDISGTVSDPFDQLLLDLNVSIGRFAWGQSEPDLDVLMKHLSGKITGPPDKYRVNLQTRLETADLPAIQISLVGEGDLESLGIEKLEADADFLNARAAGALQWSDPGSFDLDLEVQRLEPHPWVTDWPPEQFVHGRLSLSSEGNVIHLRQIGVKMAGTEFNMEGEGVLDPQSGLLDVSLTWQKLAWPPGQDAYRLASDSGRIQLSGSPDDWRFSGQMELATPEYTGGEFELNGHGDTETAKITIDKGEALGGTMAGEASLDWRTSLRWSADLDVQRIDFGALLSDWPVRLDAKLALSQDTGKDLFELQFDNLHGDFKGQAVDGSGGIVFENAVIRFENIQLHSNDSEILLNGSLADPAGLEFALDLHGQDWVADDFGGEISGRGRIALQAPQPVLDLDLKAFDLEWGETRVESILISRNTEPETNGFNLKFKAHNIEYGNLALQDIQAVLSGDRHRQSLDLELSDTDYQLKATLIGAISDWNSLTESGWSGQLVELMMTSGRGPRVTLQENAPLTISATEMALGQACFTVRESGIFCIESHRQKNGYFDLAATLSKLSLGVSDLIYEHDLNFTQMLDGEIQWLQKPGGLPSGRAVINISPGQFGDELNEVDPVTTAKGFFGFELENGNLTAGELDIPFPGIGRVDVDYAISGLALDGTGKIDGKIRIDLKDIAVLEELLPGLEKISGQLNTELQVSGLTGDPVLEGFFLLQNASADIQYLGTQLRQVRLEGTVNRNDNVTLQGEFSAGDGQGQMSVISEFSDLMAPTFDMSLSGSSLRMLNTSELRLDADADIQLSWRQSQWLVDGGIVVQQARFAPVTVVVNRVNESDDLVIVAGELPYIRRENTPAPVQLFGNLEVILGEQVQLDTDVVNARLSGAVKLNWDGQLIPIANGRVQVDGTISVFGPRLHVRNGLIRFPEVPVNNPVLNIQAERDIFGNTQIRTAGVSLTGTARRPVIEAYTNPYTNGDRAWALLITGQDVDHGQGVGAFEVGTYIAPRLYLSYGISLFDEDNIFSVRYDLKSGFGVKVSSGQRESGIDMSYTIEQ